MPKGTCLRAIVAFAEESNVTTTINVGVNNNNNKSRVPEQPPIQLGYK